MIHVLKSVHIAIVYSTEKYLLSYKSHWSLNKTVFHVEWWEISNSRHVFYVDVECFTLNTSLIHKVFITFPQKLYGPDESVINLTKGREVSSALIAYPSTHARRRLECSIPVVNSVSGWYALLHFLGFLENLFYVAYDSVLIFEMWKG